MLRLIIDIDEVLADAYGGLIQRYEQAFDINVDIDTLKGKKLRYAVPDEHFAAVLQYLYTPGFFRQLAVLPHAIEITEKLYAKYEVFVASSGMQFPQSLAEKNEWLDEHFPFIHWKRRVLCGSKKVLCGDIMIDDQAFNLETFNGKRKLLFSSLHNVDETRFERVDNWQQIAEKLL